MNTTLLVLRVVPGLLLIGHGLQKLVPPRYSPTLLHANGLRATGHGFEQLGIRPGIQQTSADGWAWRGPGRLKRSSATDGRTRIRIRA